MKEPAFFRRLAAGGTGAALVGPGGATSRDDLRRRLAEAEAALDGAGVRPGTVLAIEGRWSPTSIATLLAAIRRRAICVPQVADDAPGIEDLRRIAEVEVLARIDARDRLSLSATGVRAGHVLHATLRRRDVPGLVLFSSGSSGVRKAVVHDLSHHLARTWKSRWALRTLTFLGFDHIGGINTLLYCLGTGVCMVTVADRRPHTVLDAVERHRVEHLPTSPTFLNLALLAGAFDGRDLSALRLVTYGSEPMPPGLLARLCEALPQVELKQLYGLSEVGILASRSRRADSPWMRLGGEGFETRVRDGLLEIRARTAMLGYLNAESPFTPDGWLRTGDAVLVDGEWFRVLGRRSELINVGGEKVWPTEVEDVIQEVPGVIDVAVSGEPSPIMGQVVAARVRAAAGTAEPELARRIKQHCASRLARWQVPVRIELTEEPLHGTRMKKARAGHG